MQSQASDPELQSTSNHSPISRRRGTQIMDVLRATTRKQHERTEALPYFHALDSGALPVESYAGFLRALLTVVDVFEHEIDASSDPIVTGVWDSSMRKQDLLERDLAFFDARIVALVPASLPSAIVVAENVRQRAAHQPVSLLGYLYVLEGSALGNEIVSERIGRHFHLTSTDGREYLANRGRSTQRRWTRFRQRMNETVLHESDCRAVVEAAIEAFDGIQEIIGALYPPQVLPLHERVRELNAEAGQHSIPDDPREIGAALRAGEISWRRFPYYEWRYGDRGKRFTHSDSAWIVTLADDTQDVVCDQIEWLGRILAARGMPQWMLELHIKSLHDELVQAVPEKREVYGRLLAASRQLTRTRRKHVSETVFESLSREFDERVGPEWNERLRNTGGLLVSAVADDRSGVPHAVDSIEPWMTDESRFPAPWIDAVQHTIRKAQALSV